MIAGGYEESDGFYMVEDPEAYKIKRYREVGKVLGKATYDIIARVRYIVCSIILRP